MTFLAQIAVSLGLGQRCFRVAQPSLRMRQVVCGTVVQRGAHTAAVHAEKFVFELERFVSRILSSNVRPPGLGQTLAVCPESVVSGLGSKLGYPTRPNRVG